MSAFSRHHHLAVASTPQHGHGSLARGGVHVYEIPVIRRQRGTVHRSLGCQRHEVLAVESDAVVVDEVGILLLVHAVGREVHDTLRLVHILHLAHVPRTLGDLAQLARLLAYEIQMVVVVALARPEQALRVCEMMAPDARPVHVLVAFVLDDGAQAAVFCRHRHQTVLLVAALVILEGEGLVVAPLQVLQTVLVADLRIVCPHLLARLRIEDHGCLLHQVVARLLILLLVQLRVELILRCRLHVVHVALLHAADLAHGEVPAVGCPVDVGGIVVPRAAVHRQHALLPRAVLHGDVPAVNVGGVLAVGRCRGLCLALVVSLAPVVLPLAVVAGPTAGAL